MNDVTLVGGATAVFEHAGLRWMTDPAFSPPGDYDYQTKLCGPAVEVDAVPAQHRPGGTDHMVSELLRVPERGETLALG